MELVNSTLLANTTNDITVRDGGGGGNGGEPAAWVDHARFAIEGVTQGLVGLFGLVGE